MELPLKTTQILQLVKVQQPIHWDMLVIGTCNTNVVDTALTTNEVR